MRLERADFMDPADGEFGDPAKCMSYASVEEDDYALSELDRLCAAGFIKKFATLDLCSEFLGCILVVSNFGLIKEKPSDIKRRLTEDEQISQVPRGSPDGQQVWVCLTALIVLRVWFVHLRKHWCAHEQRVNPWWLNMCPVWPTCSLIR